jgi:predicted Rossmann fold flavoprotein
MTSDVFENYDLLIIGGGPAGIMAALSAKYHHPQFRIAIIDQTKELGRKLAISGAGRGNISNVNLTSHPETYYYGNKLLVENVFNKFGYVGITDFFSKLGVPLYEEKKTSRGKIFPVIDHAKTIRNILLDKLKFNNIEIRYETKANGLEKNSEFWNLNTTSGMIKSKYIILATGGKTYPALGSDGSGYDLAKILGHTIIPPVPSAVPLVSKNPLSQYLQGEKIEMGVTAFINGNPDLSATGEVMFTQYGFSGPGILDISRNISVRINREQKNDVMIRLNFFPKMQKDQILRHITDRFIKNPDYQVANCLWGILTEKAAGAVCAVAKIPKNRLVKDITEIEKLQLLSVLCAYEVPISGTRGWNEAEFTAGGVSSDEINFETLESKLAQGIYFSGEIVDIDGPIGGYNLSWTWASGWVAGQLESG